MCFRKQILFICILFLFSSLTFAAFSETTFNYGRQWDTDLSESYDFSNTGFTHLAMYVGDGSRDAYNPYWEGIMAKACKKNNLTPVIYAYVIAEYDKSLGNSDCDVGTPNHCTNGAETIRNHWATIISRYEDLASGFATDFGTGLTIWLIEPDFFQYSVSGDAHDTRFSQVGGGIPDSELAGKYFNEIVAAIKKYLPNAKIAVDISPWLNDNLKTWYDNFDKSKVDYLFTSGGRTQGDQERIRNDNNNLLTWAQASSYMDGKKIIADDGYGVGGGAENNYGEWLVESNLKARIADGVIGLTVKKPFGDDFYTFAKNNKYPIDGSVSSSSSSAQIVSSSSGISTNKTELVDDIEDKDSVSLWGGSWYVYNDVLNNGASTSGLNYVSGNNSNGAVELSYSLNQGSYEDAPFVGIGVTVNADENATENLSSCVSVQYDYKGAAHSFRLENPSTMTKYNYYQKSVGASDSWKTQTIALSELAQQSGWGTQISIAVAKANVRSFSFQINGETGNSGKLQIDNLKCIGLPKETLSSSSSQTSVSSSSVMSSSSAISSSSLSSSSESSSSSEPESSSSVVLVNGWNSNTMLSDTSSTGATIGQSNSYSDERVVTKNLGEVEKGTNYILSFAALLNASAGSNMTLQTTLNEYCSESSTLEKGVLQTIKCSFQAKATEEVLLTLKMPGSRWETVQISNLKLTANTEPLVFVITFDANGGEGVMTPQNFNSGESKALSENQFTKTGYTFDAWNLAADGSSVSYKDKEIISVQENQTLYALWNINKYEIQFVNGSEVLQSDSLEYGAMPGYTGTTPVKISNASYSYKFVRWEPEIQKVVADINYHAVFDSVAIFVSSSSVELSSSSSDLSSSSFVESSSSVEESSSSLASSSSVEFVSSSSEIFSSSSLSSSSELSSSSLWIESSSSIEVVSSSSFLESSSSFSSSSEVSSSSYSSGSEQSSSSISELSSSSVEESSSSFSSSSEISSSSLEISSSSAESSSSFAESSSSSEISSSSGEDVNGFIANKMPQITFRLEGKILHIAHNENVRVQVFDMQGRLLRNEIVLKRISLESLKAGNYIVRMVSKNATTVKHILLK